MNRKMNLAVAAMAAVLSIGIVAANEKAPAEYVAAMKGINAAAGPLRGHLTAKDYDGIVADVAALTPHAKVSAKFWEDKKVEDAAKWAKEVVTALGDLEKAAKAKNEEGVAAAGKVITGSCMTCHTAHRARNADGTYEIK